MLCGQYKSIAPLLDVHVAILTCLLWAADRLSGNRPWSLVSPSKARLPSHLVLVMVLNSSSSQARHGCRGPHTAGRLGTSTPG